MINLVEIGIGRKTCTAIAVHVFRALNFYKCKRI